MRSSDWSSDVCSSDLGFGGDAAIFRRGLGAGLPGAVHLVAKAPEFDVVRGFVPVALAQIGIMRAAGMVAIFEEVLRLGRPARAEGEREHRIDVGGLARSEEHTSELQSLMRSSSDVISLKKKK